MQEGRVAQAYDARGIEAREEEIGVRPQFRLRGEIGV
jgi:hypothetical protein